MFSAVPVQVTTNWQNQTLTLETGLLARQASASVLATIGETSVLAAVVIGKETNQDWLPLQVIYEERLYASGKIKGSRFVKREGRPTENAVLIGRMVDRSVRSLFNQNIRQEIQIVITVLSLDEINSPDTLAVLAASAALSLCNLVDVANLENSVFAGPVSAVRVGMMQANVGSVWVEKVANLLPSAESLNDLRPVLTEVARNVDDSIAQEKASLEEIFSMLGRKNPEWAAKFRLMYKTVEKLPRQLVLEENNVQPKIVINPSAALVSLSELDLVVSGDGKNIVMVEAGANILSENNMMLAMETAVEELALLNNFQKEFITKAGVKTNKIVVSTSNTEALNYWRERKQLLESVLYSTTKKEIRTVAVKEVVLVARSVVEQQKMLLNAEAPGLLPTYELPKVVSDFWSVYTDKEWFEYFSIEKEILDGNQDWLKSFEQAVEILTCEIVKEAILNLDKRLDGRAIDEIRPISCQIDVLPRTHGSSLFQRGETQVLNILTLGTTEDAQILDDMEDFEETTKRYIHHYNFPPYSVGETGRYSGPGRREIGHGALAEKALLPVLPDEQDFPYTLRLVSECLGSNGSTSMASTCASSLSLLTGGVPIKASVAGIAMGLVIDQNTKNFKTLTDIQGAEDHYGDMDFKVTGTKDGITALQLDNKVAGLNIEVLKEALEKARIGRMFILGEMEKAIASPKKEVSKYAPKVLTVQVPIEKIGEVIGPSGKIIKSIIAETGTTIDIDDKTGLVYIYGKDMEKVALAGKIITAIVKDYVVGNVVSGEVFRIEAYGAFVKIDGSDREGLIHISQISKERIGKVQDVLKMGQIVQAKVIEVNDRGQVSLSMKEMELSPSNNDESIKIIV